MLKIFSIFFSALSLSLIVATASLAQTYAPEFEFTNAKIENADYGEGTLHIADENLAMQEKWAKKFKEVCKKRKDCKVIELEGESKYAYDYQGDRYHDWYHSDYRVEYKDGFYYDITLDPAVIEIKLKPSTLEVYKLNAERIQTDIFDFAKKELGIKPPKETGGHIHIGFESAFEGDIKLFRNFMVDIMNHQELWTLLKQTDFRNAPPLSALPDSSFEAFEKIIDDIDSGKLKDIEVFSKRMRDEVYKVTFDKTVVSKYDIASKYQAVNTNRLGKGFKPKIKTTELRAFPVQQNAAEFILWTELMQGRIDYIKTIKGKIELKKFDIRDSKNWLKAFSEYVTQSGLKPASFKPYLLKTVPKDGCSKLLGKSSKKTQS